MVVLVCPGWHVVHWRSREGVPDTLTYVPGWQVLHAVQLAAFGAALKAPVVHAVHRRSVVALPLAATNCPAMQVVHAAHGVAGFLSWSQVPGAHAAFGVAAPAQYVPTSQGEHTAGVVAVAGLV